MLEINDSEFVKQGILNDERVKWAGLAARDILRLEAGMCLYGHDINETTTPVEAGLSWILPKDHRMGSYHGVEVISHQQRDGPPRRRIGLLSEKGPLPREGAPVVDSNGNVVGAVTSGTFSPTLEKNIAMAYVTTPKPDKLFILLRGDRLLPVQVVKMPFVPNRYYR